MFKYPLAVTIDTNIFDAAKFDLCDASPLKTLENYVKNGKIKVVLSDIVVRESKRHIADQIKKICGIMRKARAAALEESTEHLIKQIFPLIAIMRIMPMPLGIRKKKNMYLLIRYKCARNIKHGLGAELRLTEKQRHSKCFRL